MFFLKEEVRQLALIEIEGRFKCFKHVLSTVSTYQSRIYFLPSPTLSYSKCGVSATYIAQSMHFRAKKVQALPKPLAMVLVKFLENNFKKS